MTIQRLYSLPNCTLILEGLSHTTTWISEDERPLLSILVNVDCYIATSVKPLSGGQEFFESLVMAVSNYAQAFLSRVHYPVSQQSSGLVQLQKLDGNRHRLIVQAATQGLEAIASNQLPIQIDLTTVELFDLVEAIDQFLADTQTLPNLSLPPLLPSRRAISPSATLAKQSVPAVLGMYGLALSAIALFFMPIPSRRQPQPQPQYSYSATTPRISPFIQTYTRPKPPTPSDFNLEAILSAAPEITKSSQLRGLNRQLYNQLNQAWTTRKIDQNLAYRVGVTAKGAIVCYQFVNQAARTHINQTPLLDVTNRITTPESIAQFRVVFTKNGILQVSPWRGYGTSERVRHRN